MTREELHALVWSQPMITVAKAMGISDVALAKQCRRANVPVPPRGWWARKAAGKLAKITPLTPSPFVMRNYFPAVEKQAIEAGKSGKTAEEGSVPLPPVFRDIAVVKEEMEAAVKPIKVPAVVATPHIIVARLLKQDEGRKAKSLPGGYISEYFGPKFVKPIQQRRLRILSCIFFELERLGCKVSGSTHAGERFSINVGGKWTYILFGIEGGSSDSLFYRDRRHHKRPEIEQLRFDITDHNSDYKPPKCTWRDGELKLEIQATDIVCGILLSTENDAREHALWKYNYDIEERARKAREAKLAAEKAEADRIAREKFIKEAQIKRLVESADAFERAARIRRYVTTVVDFH